jgi:hypothetical protein
LAEVKKAVGEPKNTITGKKNKFVEGTLYKDIDGKKGYCYYHRSDHKVRMFFQDYKVIAIYVTRSDYYDGPTAEKVVLKDLVGGKETSKTTPDIEVEDVRKNEPSTAEKQQMKGPEVDQKDNPSSFKNELNTAKNKANPDGTFNVGTLNTREAQPVKTGIKIQKLLLQQNIREQYEVVKDNVLNSVDNGIKMMLSAGENRVSIKLHPPELGKIQVELIVKDNHVSARINTENIAVKEVIMTNLDQLKSNIENAGITVQKFDVEVGGFRNHFDRQSSDDSSGGNGRGKKEDGEPQLPGDPDWLPDKIIRQTSYSYFVGRSINYLV